MNYKKKSFFECVCVCVFSLFILSDLLNCIIFFKFIYTERKSEKKKHINKKLLAFFHLSTSKNIYSTIKFLLYINYF